MADQVNGISNGNRVPVKTSTLDTNVTLPGHIQHQINAKLLEHKAPPRIEARIHDALDRHSFPDKVKTRATHLFRTGQATSYTQARDIIMAEIKADEAHNESNGVNGASRLASTQASLNGEEPMTAVPKAVNDVGYKVVRKEIEDVVEVLHDDVPPPPTRPRARQRTDASKPRRA